MKLMKAAALSAMLCLLSACASGYAQFYNPVGGVTLPPLAKGAPDPVVLTSSGDLARDGDEMFSRGFAPIGFSSFNGPVEGASAAIKVGRKVGASYIVVSAQYAYTLHGTSSIVTPTSSTSYSSGTYSTSGGGYGTYSGSTTTSGTTTRYVPYDIPRYDQQAVYYAPIPRVGVGLLLRDIDPREASRLGTGRGALVRAVRRGSPAFQADILPGDVIQSVDGVSMSGYEDTLAAIRSSAGRTVTFVILRRGSTLRMAIAVPAGSW